MPYPLTVELRQVEPVARKILFPLLHSTITTPHNIWKDGGGLYGVVYGILTAKTLANRTNKKLTQKERRAKCSLHEDHLCPASVVCLP